MLLLKKRKEKLLTKVEYNLNEIILLEKNQNLNHKKLIAKRTF